MLLVVSLFIIANTIKLATFYRREEIAIMKMCGATNGFIRWPFVVEGMILGLTGALVAFFIQWGLYEAVSRLILQTNGLSPDHRSVLRLHGGEHRAGLLRRGTGDRCGRLGGGHPEVPSGMR